MDEVVKLVSQNPVFLTILGILILTVVVIYVVAFIQGRDISFWPPHIGQSKKNDPINKSQDKSKNKDIRSENLNLKIEISFKDILLKSDAQNDCKLIGISREEIVDFILNEVSRHPVLFNTPFTSIPIAFAQNIIIMSWDGARVYIERVLNRIEVYPNSDEWYTCVSLYRQATALQYRTRSDTPLILEAETNHVINLYRKLMRSIKKYTLLSSNSQDNFDYSVFEALLDEAEFALFNGSIDIAVVRLEALLSSIHKFLISNAPQGKSGNNEKNKK